MNSTTFFDEDLLARLSSAQRMATVIVHPARLNLLELLDREGPLTVQNVVQYTDLKRSTVSHYLRQLLKAGCVQRSPGSTPHFYSVNRERMAQLSNGLAALRPLLSTPE